MTDAQPTQNDLDRLNDAPAADRGPLNRFGRLDLTTAQRAFEPDAGTGKMRKVSFDPAVHPADMARDAMLEALTPINPAYPVIEREVLIPSKEFDLTRESLHALQLRLTDINGRYVHVAWEPNEARLGTHIGRDGLRRHPGRRRRRRRRRPGRRPRPGRPP